MLCAPVLACLVPNFRAYFCVDGYRVSVILLAWNFFAFICLSHMHQLMITQPTIMK
jgi:hypothetical protein